jgi:phosphoribosyl-AMP cyclohydrolase
MTPTEIRRYLPYIASDATDISIQGDTITFFTRENLRPLWRKGARSNEYFVTQASIEQNIWHRKSLAARSQA